MTNAIPKQKSKPPETAKEFAKQITIIKTTQGDQIQIALRQNGGVKVSTGIMRYGKRVELSNS